MYFTDLGGTFRIAECCISELVFFQDLPNGTPRQTTYATAPPGSIDRLCRMADGRWLYRDLTTDHTHTQIDLETASIWFASQFSACWLRIGLRDGKATCELEYEIPPELVEDLRAAELVARDPAAAAAEQPATDPTPPSKPASEAHAESLERYALDFQREGKSTSADLLRLFLARDNADFETVADEVHRSRVSDQAIRQNVLRTNRLLEAKNAPYRLKVASGKVFLESLPQCNWDVTGM